MYQVAIVGNKPSGGKFDTHQEALREINYLIADDRRYAREALEEAGIIVEPTKYEVVKV